MAEGIPARLTPAEGRKFGYTVGAAFAVLAAITWWRGHELFMQIFGTLAAMLVLAGALIPGRLGPVFKAWMGFAHAISRVTTPIFLAIVFFLVIGPIGIVMRLIGRNPLRHGRGGAGSFWVTRSSNRGTMSNQF